MSTGRETENQVAEGSPERRRVYLDNHATTPCDPRVHSDMTPYFLEHFGNAASRSHEWGWEAEEAAEVARARVAAAINAAPREIVFTSGATEAGNLALKGVAEAHADKGNHIITVVTEHKSIVDTASFLEKKGVEITWLDTGSDGRIDLDALRAAITERTVLISVMAGNNEVGVVQPLKEIGEIAAGSGVLFHTDAAQAVGRIPLDVEEMGIHLLSISGHKIYGPKGVGALYVRSRRPRVRLAPQMHGGGHERGLRSGTLAVPLVVGLGRACELAAEDLVSGEVDRIRDLRDRLLAGITERLPECTVNGSMEHRLPNNLNISFAYVEGESLLMGMKDIAVSSGSACTSASREPSYVLRALGVGRELAHTSIRFGLGRFTTEEDIDFTVERVVSVVSRLREISPLWEKAEKRANITKA